MQRAVHARCPGPPPAMPTSTSPTSGAPTCSPTRPRPPHASTSVSTPPRSAAWRGRAAVSAPAGSWTTVSSSALTYDWALVDLGSGATVDRAGSATPAQFAADHGNGPGFAVTGFGCDGKAFNLDAVRGSGSTFDFEGVSLSTAIAVGRQQVKPDEQVELTGRVTDGSGRLTGDPLVLESRAPGGQWAPVGKPVLAERDGVARVAVPVAETTEFRWHRAESQYADEGWSDVVTVTVDKPQEPQPGDQQTQQPGGQQGGDQQAGDQQGGGQQQPDQQPSETSAPQ